MYTWFTARCSRRVLTGGAVVASGLVLAFLRRPAAEAESGRTGARPRFMVVPSSGASRESDVSVVPVTEHTRLLPKADSFRVLIVTVMTDARAPMAVRYACRRLIGAIQTNNQTRIEEALVSLEHAAARTRYPLPEGCKTSDLGRFA